MTKKMITMICTLLILMIAVAPVTASAAGKYGLGPKKQDRSGVNYPDSPGPEVTQSTWYRHAGYLHCPDAGQGCLPFP
jgi:hypothetical protein